MTGQAQTPGQAPMMPDQAYWEAYVIARDGELDSDPEDISRWENLPENLRGWVGTGVQAAIDVFLAGDSVSAGTIREALAAQERPAPGLAELASLTDAMHALAGTLDSEADETSPGGTGSLHDIAWADALRSCAKRVTDELAHHRAPAGARPAPGTVVKSMPRVDWARVTEAVADREREITRLTALLAVSEAGRDSLRQQCDNLRALLDDFTHAVIDLDARGAIVKAAHAVRKKAGMTVIDGFSKPGGQ